MVSTGKKRNHSHKRDAILSALVSSDLHPSAEQLLASLKAEIPDLSLGTVYRNLSLFCEEGLAVSVGVVNGQERFDGKTAPHMHFICRSCGAVRDIVPDEPGLDDIPRIEAIYGCRIKSRRTEYLGTCADCLASGSCGE